MKKLVVTALALVATMAGATVAEARDRGHRRHHSGYHHAQCAPRGWVARPVYRRPVYCPPPAWGHRGWSHRPIHPGGYGVHPGWGRTSVHLSFGSVGRPYYRW